MHTFQHDLAVYGPAAAARGRRWSLAEAQAYCRRLARTHYENFTVASWLLPAELRQHFCNVYAYCRWADDLADETSGASESLELLDWWESQLAECYRGVAVHPVFVALEPTIRELEIPIDPFRDLLVAFRQDQTQTRYETFDDLLGYCRNSANPVGRLVLYLGRSHDDERGRLADSICTGLQLANFWQDVARDYDRGRIYLPQESCRRAGYDESMFARREFNPQFRRLLAAEVDRAEGFFRAGERLVEMVPQGLRIDVRLFVDGGLAILDAIRRADYNVWRERPAISKAKKLRLVARAWWQSLRRPVGNLSARSDSDLDASYALCERLAREAASNFHYAFRLLPREKRRAMCALYAYLRAIDDLADDSRPDIDSLDQLKKWRSRLTSGLRIADDPIAPAVLDTIRRYAIPIEYLTAVIDGVEMDLHGTRYETFTELEQYCYRVASVVGMACIHVWGFRSSKAIELARRCGIAFQLTNILRDLKEDAQRGRVYLPAEDLRRFGCTAEQLERGEANARFEALMQFEIARCEQFYAAADELEPLLGQDGRRVLRAMTLTYRKLLGKIKRRPSDVLRHRVALAAWEKFAVAARAIAGRSRRLRESQQTATS